MARKKKKPVSLSKIRSESGIGMLVERGQLTMAQATAAEAFREHWERLFSGKGGQL